MEYTLYSDASICSPLDPEWEKNAPLLPCSTHHPNSPLPCSTIPILPSHPMFHPPNVPNAPHLIKRKSPSQGQFIPDDDVLCHVLRSAAASKSLLLQNHSEYDPLLHVWCQSFPCARMCGKDCCMHRQAGSVLTKQLYMSFLKEDTSLILALHV